jgi:hypothetical protein
VTGALLSRPYYHTTYVYGPPPPVVYYAPPPPPGPVCQQDNVYRYLPDGSVQWGVRTRCY